MNINFTWKVARGLVAACLALGAVAAVGVTHTNAAWSGSNNGVYVWWEGRQWTHQTSGARVSESGTYWGRVQVNWAPDFGTDHLWLDAGDAGEFNRGTAGETINQAWSNFSR